MNDIHGLKQAQEALRASEAELRLIMDNVPARVVVHRPRLPLPLPQPPQRGMAGREPQGADRPRVADVVGDDRVRADRAAARPRAEGRDGVRPSSCSSQPDGERALGVGPLRAEPRRRRQRGRHLRRAHRHPRPEAQRGRAAPRQLDAVVAHQQHAARGARVGPRLPAGALVAAGARTSSAGAPTRCCGMPLDRQPAAARGRPRARRRARRRA